MSNHTPPIPERTIARIVSSHDVDGSTCFSVVYPTRESERTATFTVPTRSIRRVNSWFAGTLWFVPGKGEHTLYVHPKEQPIEHGRGSGQTQ